MENASKALIIAGAILLSILIISLGITIFNQAKQVVGSTSGSMDAVEISTFNSKFEAYEGSNISGSNVNALLNVVLSNNRTNAAANEDSKLITVNSTDIVVTSASTTGGTNYTSAVTKKAQTGYTYTVTFTTNNAGLYNSVSITKNT